MRVYCAPIVLVLTTPALAQDKTLLGEEIESGGYGAPVVKFGRILGGDGVFVGGQGGWIINHAFVLGGGGYGLANRISVNGSDCPYLGFGYGGLLLEYIISPRELVHGSVQRLIGAGGVSYSEEWRCNDAYSYESDAFFALEPAAHLMLNLHKKVRAGIGASYRYVNGVQFEELSDSDLSGATAQIIVKFGVFYTVLRPEGIRPRRDECHSGHLC
ncbi:MAG: hypothetical protein ABIJ00_02080 [Candidatus Eisenbacteria bacterium]